MPLKDPEARRAYHKEYMKRYLTDPGAKAKHIARASRNNKKYKGEVYGRVNEIKSVPCADCGGTFDPICMDFDHLPGNKKADNVSTMISRGFPWEVIQAEISKCEVVCANCHRLRTHNRRGN